MIDNENKITLEKNEIFFRTEETSREGGEFSTWYVKDIFTGSNNNVLYLISELDSEYNNSFYLKEEELENFLNSIQVVYKGTFAQKENELKEYLNNYNNIIKKAEKVEIKNLQLAYDMKEKQEIKIKYKDETDTFKIDKLSVDFKPPVSDSDNDFIYNIFVHYEDGRGFAGFVKSIENYIIKEYSKYKEVTLLEP